MGRGEKGSAGSGEDGELVLLVEGRGEKGSLVDWRERERMLRNSNTGKVLEI